jgi:hypothetical protein
LSYKANDVGGVGAVVSTTGADSSITTRAINKNACCVVRNSNSNPVPVISCALLVAGLLLDTKPAIVAEFTEL